MPLTSEQKKETQDIIGKVIIHLMEGVLNNALYKKPFIFDKWKAEKPLYAALVPKEIFKGSHFERKFVTPFGHVWEKLSKVVGTNFHGYATTSQVIQGNVPEERLRRITEILNRLEHSEKGKKRVKPNWDEELSYILEGDGNLIPVTVVSDVFIRPLAKVS